jgi:hypothetical protein
MGPVSQTPRRYFIEFNAAMLLYIAAVVGRKFAIYYVGDPTLKTLILISPIVPIMLIAFAVVRFYRRIDEYHRLQILESLAISAGVTAVVTISWIFLEDVGFPHLSIFYALTVMAASWWIASLYFGWKDKVSEGKAFSTLKSVAATLFLVGVATAVYALIANQTGLPWSWPVLLLIATFVFLVRAGFFIFSKKSASC